MPADPTANLGASRLETLPAYIGHVAPSFKSPKRFNALAIRPRYRISLKLGDIESLFCTQPDTPAGRMARLQVLGLFYWPLNHRVAAGGTPPPITTNTMQTVKDKASVCKAKASTLKARANTAAPEAQTAKDLTDQAAADPTNAPLAANAWAAVQTSHASVDALKTAADEFKLACDDFHAATRGTGLESAGDRMKYLADWVMPHANSAKNASDANQVNWTTNDTDTVQNSTKIINDNIDTIKADADDNKDKCDNYRAAAPQVDSRLAPNQEAYRVAWDYFKQNFVGKGGNASDAEADKEIQKRLKEWVIQQHLPPFEKCLYNRDGATPGGGRLPIPAPEGEKPDEAKGHYAKIRLPGGYTLLQDYTLRFNVNADDNPDIPRMGLTSNPFAVEDAVYKHNEVLGKIPLIAVVEKWATKEGKWKRAGKDVEVRFGLVHPYDLPDFNANRGLNTQLNRPPMRESVWSKTHPNPPSRDDGTGPRHFTSILEGHSLDDNKKKTDPQWPNAHADFGGKREHPSGVDDVIFKLGDVPGFTKPHDPPPAAIGGGAPRPPPPPPQQGSKGPQFAYFQPVESIGDTTLHAVKTKTNDNGEAGAIFMPSRLAGDRYRLRVWVHDPEMVSDDAKNKGEGMEAARVETGTFVVWRNIRWSRLATLKLPAPSGLNAHMVSRAKVPPDTNPASGASRAERWMWPYLAIPEGKKVGRGLAKIEIDGPIRDGKKGSPFNPIHLNFARGFCELECDPKFFRDITNQEWKDARDTAIADAARVGMRELGLILDLDLLFFKDGGSSAHNIDHTTGFLLPARTPKDYDVDNGMGPVLRVVNPADLDAVEKTRAKLGSLILNYLYPGFMRSISKNGYLPGFTIVHALFSTNLMSESDDGDLGIGFSGMALDYNGAFNFFGCEDQWPEKIGDDVWFGYGYTCNVLHEIGHVVYKEHDAGLHGGKPAGGPKPQYHDNAGYVTEDTAKTDEPPHGTCVMSYRWCEGEFCAKCCAGLRGWNIKGAAALHAQMPAPAAAPPPVSPPPPGSTPAPKGITGFFKKLFGH